MTRTSFTIRSPRNAKNETAFTLIELLVVIAIISLLAVGGGVAYLSASRARLLVQEVNAGRQLIAAYHLYATEHDGELMPGYDKFVAPFDRADGQNIFGESAFRYPYRLSEYLKNKDEEIFLAGENRKQIETINHKTPPPHYGYFESLCPSLGMNSFYVGGYIEDSPGVVKFGDAEVARRMNQVRTPSQLIVFASSFMTVSNEEVKGHFYVKAPKFVARAPGVGQDGTPDWPDNGQPDSRGFLDDRHNGKVLCVFLDGSVRTHTLEELSTDMRYWSHLAGEADNPNYAPTLAGGSTGGGRPRR